MFLELILVLHIVWYFEFNEWQIIHVYLLHVFNITFALTCMFYNNWHNISMDI